MACPHMYQLKRFFVQFAHPQRLELKFKAKKLKSTQSVRFAHRRLRLTGLNQLPVVFETTLAS